MKVQKTTESILQEIGYLTVLSTQGELPYLLQYGVSFTIADENPAEIFHIRVRMKSDFDLSAYTLAVTEYAKDAAVFSSDKLHPNPVAA